MKNVISHVSGPGGRSLNNSITFAKYNSIALAKRLNSKSQQPIRQRMVASLRKEQKQKTETVKGPDYSQFGEGRHLDLQTFRRVLMADSLFLGALLYLLNESILQLTPLIGPFLGNYFFESNPILNWNTRNVLGWIALILVGYGIGWIYRHQIRTRICTAKTKA